MGYTLEAVIGATETLVAAAARHPGAVVLPLWRDLSLMPITFVDESPDGTALGFWDLPAGFDQELSAWSATTPVAYVEAEYFGGVGSQRAALWSAGTLTVGPITVDEGEPFAPEGSPISQILAHLGVERVGHQDEFDIAGLDRHRSTEDWLA